ncbi:hypothetical protein C2845_PM10G09580 [Panicum miliaceum]|uniref:Uncharacterized protein n=1 Tax=Panicum miliaceum TaxID=4540 RepID=A0A3L6PBG5_PANMI|nr:hypothetical protein C2845_PM10G09580 [Panicum miliaceum]
MGSLPVGMAPKKRRWGMDMGMGMVVVVTVEDTAAAMAAIHQDMVGMVEDTDITLDMVVDTVADTVITLGMVVDMAITTVMVVNMSTDMEDTVVVVAPVAVGTELQSFATIMCVL